MTPLACSLPFTFRTRFLRRRKLGRWLDRPFEEALFLYLKEGLSFHIDSCDVTHWRHRTSQAGAVLARRLEEPPERLSSSEEILLAVPLIEPPPASITEVNSIVDGYVDQIHQADRANDDAYLSVLAEYGRRYELICEVEVPLLEPFRVKVEEDRPLGLKTRGAMTHDVVIGGSRSMHIEARTTDSNVVLGKKMELNDAQGKSIFNRMELVRITPEGLALYSSDEKRPYIATLSLRLRVAFQLTVAALLLTMISLIAAISALSLTEDRFLVGSLSVLVVPTTVASAFVLTREDSPLATRLQRYWRGGLAIATLALWLVVVGRLISYDAQSEKNGGATARPGKVNQEKGAFNGTQRSKGQRTSRSGQRAEPKP
jgi:hypothetical protein